MADAWRSYLEMAYGLSKTSRKKAEKAVREVVGKSGAKASELQQMVEDLLATSGSNRDALVEVIRTELDRALNRVGLAKAEDVAVLRERVAELEASLAVAPSAAAADTGKAEPAAAKRAAPAKKAVKAAPAASTAKSGAASGGAAGGAKKAATAKKVVVKKTVAKKTAAKKAGT
jgi:polyhydroxyalkanoate synthesis regulator phasin